MLSKPVKTSKAIWHPFIQKQKTILFTKRLHHQINTGLDLTTWETTLCLNGMMDLPSHLPNGILVNQIIREKKIVLKSWIGIQANGMIWTALLKTEVTFVKSNGTFEVFNFEEFNFWSRCCFVLSHGIDINILTRIWNISIY